MKKLYYNYYFYDESNNKIDKSTIPGTTQNAIKSDIRYNDGQLILNITPVVVSHKVFNDGELYSMEEFKVFTNIRILLDTQARYAPKKCQVMVDKLTARIDTVAELFLAGELESVKTLVFASI